MTRAELAERWPKQRPKNFLAMYAEAEALATLVLQQREGQ